jgi:dihydroorotate dehydrogenase
MYTLLRPLLFKFDAEKSHHLAFKLAHLAYDLKLLPQVSSSAQAHQLMGLTFPNRVGLAAGLDKNGEQNGNPQPRLFRLPEANAIINRMGFNNLGVDNLIENVKCSPFAQNGGIIGINIGKNADTPIENAVDDYLIGLSKVYAHASYITVNISSPNTKNLRDLQSQDALDALLGQLKQSQLQLANAHHKYVPMTLKIAPDVDDEQIVTIAELLKQHKIDGVIATNTTLDKTAVQHLPNGAEMGGLSGEPVRNKSTEVIQKLQQQLKGEVPIIGAGGILNGSDAVQKINAGADLVQVYSGLIYQGPSLVKNCLQALPKIK